MTIAERNEKRWPEVNIPDSIREEIQTWIREKGIHGRYEHVEYPGASEYDILDFHENR